MAGVIRTNLQIVVPLLRPAFGGAAALMAQREPDGQRHHISHSLREGDVEVVSGWTTRHGDPLGTFTFTVELDEDDRARRLFAARTEAFGGAAF